jgi:hypothetical protein
MNKISIALFSIIAMAGVASAQQAKGSASAGATVNAGGATGAATGTAKAGAGAATGAAGSAAQGAKGATGAAQGTAAQAGGSAQAGAAAAVTMPKPPAEIKDTLKVAGARQTCKGTGLGMDMKTSRARRLSTAGGSRSR